MKKLYEGGWICATWPQEYGGKGLSMMQGVVLAEEFARAKAPLRADFFGDTLVGPTILQWGTEEQKKEFLPQIMQGRIRWCQGFSEPNSGSDLASLKTTAVLDGNEWVINGQKVWTTQAQFADYCFLLARTDPDAVEAHGHLLPARADAAGRRRGRGITQPDGTAEFNEVFFSDARCPADNVVGGVNNGWAVTNTTLGFERGQSATTGYRRFHDEWHLMAAEATANGTIHDPVIRQRLATYYAKIQIIRINGLRTPHRHLHRPQGPLHRRSRRHQQDAVVGDAQGGDGARARHLRRRRRCSRTWDRSQARGRPPFGARAPPATE